MKRVGLVFAAFYLLVYVVPLDVRPLLTPDETRYAEIPREMLVSGDWIVPRMVGLTYYEKPPMAYWMNAVSIAIFGKNAFAVRITGVLAAALTTLLVWLTARRFLGARAATMAAIVHASCALVFIVGVINLIDGPLTLFLTAAMAAFLFGYEETRPGRRRLYYFLFGVACGLAFLTKGFLAFAVPVIAIFPFLLWERRSKSVLASLWLPLLGVAAVALPWCILVDRAAEGFWHHFFWIEHVKRFFSGQDQHREPFWYFVPVFVAGSLPAIGLLRPYITAVRAKAVRGTLARYAFTWFVMPFLFFSMSSGKLGTYILPCFPPFALLSAICFEHFIAHEDVAPLRKGVGVAALLAVALAVGVVVVRLTGAASILRDGEAWKAVAYVAALLWCAGFLWRAIRAREPRNLFLLYFASPVLIYVAMQVALPARLGDRTMPGPFIRQAAPRLGPETVFVSSRVLAPAVAWELERTDLFIIDQLIEVGWGIEDKDAFRRVLSVPRLVDLARSGNHVVLIIRKREFNDGYAARMPPTRFRIEGPGYLWLEWGESPPTTSDTK